MNILSVQKTIPVRTTWIDGDQKQIKSVTYNVCYSLRTEADEDTEYSEAYLHQNISFQIFWTGGKGKLRQFNSQMK